MANAAKLTPKQMAQLGRQGFTVVMYETLQEFYLAEALEHIYAWKQSTPDNPVGICGPVGPTEQLPLVARLVNDLSIDVRSAHFWGMDEWVDENGTHDNAFGQRLTTLMLSKGIADTRVPMSLLSDHPNVQFNFYRPGIGTCEAEMH